MRDVRLALAIALVVAAFGVGATTTALSYVSGTIRVAFPSAAVTGKITVTNAAGSATSAGAFKVVPTISGVSPSSALVGAMIAVHGTTFTGATAVRIGTVAATDVHVVDGGTVTAVVPSAATTAKVSVTTPGGTATSSAALTVIHPPTISSFSPASGWAGSTVTVAGTNLDSVTAVTFGGAEAAAIVPVSPTQLRAVVPADAVTGKLAVANAAATAVSATDF